MSKIKNPKLAKKGKVSYEWARSHMQILDNTLNRLKKSKPLKGITLGFCLQLTKETSVLLMGAKELGAKVAACSGNPLTTQDDIAAFLSLQGIHVYGWSRQTQNEFVWCINKVLDHFPQILTDDGGELSVKAHFDPKYKSLKILGATEETTTGLNRLHAIEKKGFLRFPIIAVNDAYTKHMFDNRYGTGQSTIDGYLRAMNLLFASKRVVVVGYGWVGKGVAARAHGMGSKVIVTEVDPLKALEAHMDGFEVMPMAQAARVGDIFITCTGMTSVIRKEHLIKMKNGAVVGNVGHFDVEVDTKFLLKESLSVRKIRQNLDECLLRNGKIIYLIAKGRVANLVATEGHPPEIMAMSFSNQIFSILHILKNHKKLVSTINPIPRELDQQIAKNALLSMNVRIDKLSKNQILYKHSW